jgi:hypothetical protein
MFLEFPKEWRRTGKLLLEPPPPPSTQFASPGTDLELSTHVPRSEGTMFRVYQYLNLAGYWMTPGLKFGCEYCISWRSVTFSFTFHGACGEG